MQGVCIQSPPAKKLSWCGHNDFCINRSDIFIPYTDIFVSASKTFMISKHHKRSKNDDNLAAYAVRIISFSSQLRWVVKVRSTR